MRDIQLVLERWGGWAASEGTQVSWNQPARCLLHCCLRAPVAVLHAVTMTA